MVIKDYVLALLVLCLVVIDILILLSYMAIEGSRDSLGVRLTSNKENTEDTVGVCISCPPWDVVWLLLVFFCTLSTEQPTYEVHSYSLYICEARGQVALFTVLFGYKGLLQVTALLLAFSTRKVKVKGLNDSKYIAAAIYVTSIVLAVTVVSTYTLMDYVNIYPAVVGIGFLLGTTMILGLVFVPRVSHWYWTLLISTLSYYIYIYIALYTLTICLCILMIDGGSVPGSRGRQSQDNEYSFPWGILQRTGSFPGDWNKKAT